ncbi:MAG: ABC transporter permease subunit [Chloroflexota bacterium]|nr:ABC transporter permease subunit [Chloroflexota bacterium]
MLRHEHDNTRRELQAARPRPFWGSVRALRRSLTVPLTLAPALGLIALLFGTSVVYGGAQSLGYLPFLGQTTFTLAAYRNVLSGTNVAHEFWIGLGFSLWVCGTATLLAALCALVVVMLFGDRLRGATTGLVILNINLAFPHLVWAVGLSLLLAQSGLLARGAALLGLITLPAEFPVLIRDRFGIGIILDYVTKETPFLVLILLGILRSQPETYGVVAENLGATRWQRLRYVTLPLVLPGLSAGALLVFAYVFGAYEVPAVLGVRYPQMLSVLALEFFANPDLHSRAEGMAISVIMALVVLTVALIGYWLSHWKVT